MKTLYSAEVLSVGARSGTLKSLDGLLNLTLGNPLDTGLVARGPNPELLFAGAYSACFHGALINAAQKHGTSIVDSKVRAIVSLMKDDHGGYCLATELHAQIPGVNRTQMQLIMDEAHLTCPYSKALRGDSKVKLIAD